MDWVGAESVLRCAVRLAGDRFDLSAELRIGIGVVWFEAGDYGRAESELADLLGEVCARSDASTRLRGTVANSLGVVCKTAGRFDDAAEYYAVAQAAFAAEVDRDERATVLHNLAGLSHARGEPGVALGYGWEGLALRRAVHGDDHPLVAADRSNLSAALCALGRLDEASRQLDLAIGVFRAHYGERHPEVAVCLSNLASIDADRGRTAAAERGYREAVLIKQLAHGERHPDTLITCYNLARLLVDSGATSEAAHLLEDVVSGLTGVVAAEHVVLARASELRRTLAGT